MRNLSASYVKMGMFGMMCIMLLSCNLINISVKFMEPSATPTFTDTPTLTSTPIPTETQTPTLTLTSTPTLKPSPTNVPVTDTPYMAHVIITNKLGIQLTITLKNKSTNEVKYVALKPQDIMAIDILPGEYEYTLTAVGYIPLTGTRFFLPGDNTWKISKS